MAKKNTDKVVFHQIKVLKVKGVSVAAPDGKVVFIPNVVPGDVVDVQTFKSASPFTKEKQCISRIFRTSYRTYF
jgi:23S rRNA (uracil1939-C5)-methyltransferase